MELTYHDIMTADFTALTSTAKKWRSMATSCGTLHDHYRDDVRGKLRGWAGGSAQAFWLSSGTTLHEFDAAKKQALKIASLLEDAHSRLTEAKSNLEKVKERAEREGGMKVDAYGKCVLDTSGMGDKEARNALRDPASAEVEAAWNRRIETAVKDVDDTDYENMLALKAAAKDTDGKGDANGFNSKAVGDVEEYAAKHTANLMERLDSTKDGGGLSAKDRHDFQVMMRANADDKDFHRTVLNTVGPEGLIDATNQLNALAYRTDTPNRQQYLAMQGDLATSLAMATKVPEFRDGRGKRIPVSSDAYGERYRSWLHSKDGAFYDNWRGDMRRAGAREWSYASGPAGSAGSSAIQGRGYQSLVTLMEHGDGYSPQMLYDLGDDIRAAEEKDPDIWDRRGPYGAGDQGEGIPGMSNGQFQNDPLDGVLGIMAKDPDTAAGYLDPASNVNAADENGEKGRNDRLEYLVKERDWQIVDAVGADNASHHDKLDANTREGFEEALKAGATGRLPDSHAGTDPPHHSAANAGVMEEAVRVFGGEGKGTPPIAKDQDFVGFRGTLGEMIADYPGDVQREVTGDDKLPVYGEAAHFDNGSLHEYLNQVGRDPHAHGVVKASQQMYSVEHLQDVIHNLPPGVDRSDARDAAGDAVAGGAYVSGALSEAKADALYQDKVDSARDFNEGADEASKWVNRFVGLGTGSIGGEPAGAALSTPMGWAQEDINEAVMNQIKRDVPAEAADGEAEGRYKFIESQTATRDFYRDYAGRIGAESGLDPSLLEGVRSGVREQALTNFQNGSGSVTSHGEAPPAE